MKICKKCGIGFDIIQYIDGKQRNLQRRKYCLSCSPFGQRNTTQLEKPLSIPKNKLTQQIMEHNCPLCNRLHHAKTVKCMTCLNRESRHRLKIKAVEYKGGKCARCGYEKHVKALVFHHVNPEEKEFQFSANTNHAWEYVRKELDKCLLLCCNCHAEIHAELEKISY